MWPKYTIESCSQHLSLPLLLKETLRDTYHFYLEQRRLAGHHTLPLLQLLLLLLPLLLLPLLNIEIRNHWLSRRQSLCKELPRHFIWVVGLRPLYQTIFICWIHWRGTHHRRLNLLHHRWVLTAHDRSKCLMNATATICIASDAGRWSKEVLSDAQVVLAAHHRARCF